MINANSHEKQNKFNKTKIYLISGFNSIEKIEAKYLVRLEFQSI
jgi:hypothetical protein